jgi:glycosyltransferase involved in cell wall biosynthesis
MRPFHEDSQPASNAEPADTASGQALKRENWLLRCQLAETRHALAKARNDMASVLGSRSWRLTAWLRKLASLRGIGEAGAKPGARLRSVEEFGPALERGEERLLLVDVTELAIENLQGGIQHTVKGILSEWLFQAPPGWDVMPVQLTREGRYVAASQHLGHLFGDLDDRRAWRVVDVGEGDIFLGLDLLRDHAATLRTALAGLKAKGAQVYVVLYDLLPVDLPHCVPENIARSFGEWLLVIRDLADGVACISQTVATHFSRWLDGQGVEERPEVSSFRLGVPAVMTDGRAPSASKPSLLMVSTLEPRKGYAEALDAIERIWSDGTEIHLTIVGRYGWGVPELLSRLETHPQLGRNLVWLRSATDAEVQAEYRAADALLFCSLGEGFGLPIIEAAQHRLPLILRDLPEFREVAGDRAYYFTGSGWRSIYEAIQGWLQLRQAGSVQLPAPDIAIGWHESASQLLEALQSMRARRLSHGGAIIDE